MDNDDKPIGIVLSRRDALKVLGFGSVALLISCTAPEVTDVLTSTPGADPTLTPAPSATQASASSTALSCVVRPELTIGPYFVDDQLNRSDIRSEPSKGSIKEGIPLNLAIGVFDVSQNNCNPVEGAQVDIWHCDAQGVYSGFANSGFDTSNQKFLRGYQLTDGSGGVKFLTIYPGWYSGRAVHIHFMIRTTGADGQAYEFVSQFFFDDALTDQVLSSEPYASKGYRNVLNANDTIFSNGGDQLILNTNGENSNGYSATINIGLDLSDSSVGASDSFGGPGGGPP